MTTAVSLRNQDGDAIRRPAADRIVELRLRLFARTWAVAALFHLAGNARDMFDPQFDALGLAQLLVGGAAIWTLVQSRRFAPLLLLCSAIPISAWFEAPVVGNHWVLAALLSLAFVFSAARAAFLSAAGVGVSGHTWRAFAPTARLSLVIAYAFFAFSKLNAGFLDASESCAVYYHDQLLTSWGLQGLGVTGNPLLGRAIAIATVAVELSIPFLLVATARLRRAGLLVAVGFHWLLALDLLQHFWDFSSVLFAGFLLFADDRQVEAMTHRLNHMLQEVRPSVRRLMVAAALSAGSVVTVASVLPPSPVVRVVPVLLGHGFWMMIGTVLLVITVATTRATTADRRFRPLQIPRSLVLVIPVLVILNGLSPYLELKTGFGWNMYSNLRTVAGETNHLLVPATLDVTGSQRERIVVLASSDPDLANLNERQYSMVWTEFGEWAAAHPDASVTYRMNGQTRTVARVGDDPALDGGSALSRRLQPYRLVDESGSERCLTHFAVR